ncbi:hypothetical protein LTR27_005314 [Elasticomyces elasticus]|nr:hypothetical protein LTR27_005314 [Elasticomyces elasticus]
MTAQTDTAVALPCNQSTTFISNLFRLPAELRLQIYSSLLFTKPSRISLDDYSSATYPLRIDGNTILPPVMRIAKSIREDAIGLYLQHLQELQIVLAARQKDCATHLKNFMAKKLHAAEPAHGDDASTPVTGLFKLPAELRLTIYGHLFPKLDLSNIEKRLPSDVTLAKIQGCVILPSLMRVSKLIREDAIGLYQQHLRDARVVLTGRKEGVEELMRRVKDAYRFSATCDGPDRTLLWRDRVDGYCEQVHNNRTWIVRVDQVAAQVTRSA